MQTLAGVEMSAGIYMLLAVLSGGLVAMRVLDYDGTNWLLLILAVLLVALLFFRIWLVGMLYLAILVFLNHTEPRYLFAGPTPFDTSDVMFAAACLGFIIFASRYLTMLSPVRTYGAGRPTWRESLRFLLGAFRPAEEVTAEKRIFDPDCHLGRRQKQIMKPDELVSGALRIALGVGVAFAILQFVPLMSRYDARYEYGLRGPAVRLVTIGWLIIAGLLFLKFITGRIRRWQSRREAEMFLRSEATRGLFTELRSMAVRLVKHRQRTLVRRLADPVQKAKPAERREKQTNDRGGNGASAAASNSASGHSTRKLAQRQRRAR